ncbi:hypothetical protein OBBRIDRAFT_184129 [Obba rivulosa]|uniref:DUF6533 domain-containing protein n=1 Tax=Obba rivulosa TaxID=1052685 RepID=A0A8E2DHG1_9APHY|nr:hypothetical protein OBBRIDRAFT_184129 [Obba rivulosa]
MSTSTQAVATFVQSEIFEGSITLALSALVFYDHLCILSLGIEHIWGRRFISVTLLFHLNRWTTFVHSVVNWFTFYLFDTLPPHCPALIGFCTPTCLVYHMVGGGSWRLSTAVCALSMVPAVTNAYRNFGLIWY